MTSGADGASTNGGNWRTSTATSLHTSTAATAGRPRLRPAHLLRRPAQPQTAKPPSRLCPDTSLPDSPIPRTHPCRFPYGKPEGAPGGGADTCVVPLPPGRPWPVRAPRHDPAPDPPGGQAAWMATVDRLDRTGRVSAGPCPSSRLQNGTRLCNRPGRPGPSRCRSRTSPRKREGWPSSRLRSCFRSRFRPVSVSAPPLVVCRPPCADPPPSRRGDRGVVQAQCDRRRWTVSRPGCGCGRPDHTLAWPCGQVLDRARPPHGRWAWPSLAGRELTCWRPIPGSMRARPDRRAPRRCPGGKPARVCPRDGARRGGIGGTGPAVDEVRQDGCRSGPEGVQGHWWGRGRSDCPEWRRGVRENQDPSRA